MTRYPPYEIAQPAEALAQGDILLSVPLVDSPRNVENPNQRKAVVELYDLIVLTQSCDLAQDIPKVNRVVVCPVWKLEDFVNKSDLFSNRNKKEQIDLKNRLRQGTVLGFHLLMNPDIDTASDLDDFLVVDFRSTSSVLYRFLVDFAISIGPRLRLLPPYREHLSQAFARFFMRVGLPVDIPPFTR